ncbi:four-carbon acid sugar kinase family protein [Streptomyces sp. NPDC059442]|uniref:four-carbon acid sugar kinase family protein n=1 Tax=Streptomyces sp. NPDC059442 TaxID=3346830 RepID=UPI0036B0B9C9
MTRNVPITRMNSIVVLADDLTSAGDGAAPFRRAGHRARVLLPGRVDDDVIPPHDGEGVVAVDLGSRLLGSAVAGALTERAASAHAGADLLIKTVDSTLRGHIAAEIRAAREGSGRRAVVIAPAFPAEGRTTVAGVQHVRGVPVHESEFARDPVHPVVTSDLTLLLPEAEAVDAGDQKELDLLPELLSRGGVCVCSAATDADLDRLVAAVPRPGDVLWVGSPGLAAALARHHPRIPAAAALPRLPAAQRPLVAVGSAHPATRRQLERLRTRPDVTAVHTGSGSVSVSASVSGGAGDANPSVGTGADPRSSGTDPEAGSEASRGAGDPAAAVEALRRSDAPVLVVHTPDGRCDPAQAESLTDELAVAAARSAAEGLADGLLVTGGETAAAVLAALGATGIELFDEPEPGIARGALLGPLRIPVLIKAGGFGDDATLERLTRLLIAGGDSTARG